MVAIVRPSHTASFSTLGRVPGDVLDSQLHNLIEAIVSTQKALADIRRDDGQLKAQPALHPKVKSELEAIERRIRDAGLVIAGAADKVTSTTHDISLLAKDAENAAVVATRAAGRAAMSEGKVLKAAETFANDDDIAETWAADSENWANFSKANAQNAEADQEMAAAWAEYLAGPVVNPSDAPAYAQTTPYGHGLYYQPVEGGIAGLWSAKWWALQAYQLVGHWNFYYLGAWPDPPFPGSTNPDTGLTTPNPLAPGSFYYNTENNQLYIWDGTQWTTPISLTAAYLDNFVYIATASQKAFTGPDRDGKIPTVASSPSDVHLNGIKLVPTTDYTIDAAANTLHLVVGAPAGAVLQWDLLVPTSDLAPGAISVFKIQMSPVPDGAIRTFDMNYTHPTMGVQPTAASQIAEINISLDGIVQEPGVDFTVSGGHTLTMAQPPLLDSRFWGTWHASDLIVP